MKRMWLFALGLLLWGCAANRPVNPVGGVRPMPEPPAKAVEHFRTGALYDFVDQYKNALLEYYQALVYDSTAAEIYKAIGRDLMRLENYESALQYLQRGLRLAPEDREILYYLAEIHYQLRHFARSAHFFERFLSLDPYNTSVQNNLLFLYGQMDSVDKVIALRKKLLDVRGLNDENTYQLISLYVKTKHYAEAEALLNRLVRENSDEPLNWLLKGNLLMEVQKDTAAAINAYQKALELDSENEEIVVRLYRLFQSRGDWKGLVRTFGRLLDKHPDDAQTRLIIAEGLLNLKKYDEARQVIQPLLRDGAHASQAYMLLGRIADAREQYLEAANYFRKVTQKQPKNKLAWLSLALSYSQAGNHQEALNSLQEALDLFPQDLDLLSFYGSTLNQLNRYQEAARILWKVNRKAPQDINTVVALGVALENLKQYNQLDSLYEAALQEHPEAAILLNNYSYSLAERGIRLEEALQMAQKAVSLEPNNGAYLDTIGWIYYKLGNLEQAASYLTRAVELRADSPVVIEHLGDVYFKMGKRDQALQYWRRALEMDPQNQALKEKISHP